MSHLTKCPICGSEGQSVYSLKADFIRTQLQLYYNEPLPEQIGLIDYEILRCGNCTLEYAMPLQAGSELFYQWITSRSGYYPDERWEWFNAIDLIKTNHYDGTSALEVGCGSGNFLEMAQSVPNLKVVGLDTTITSVDHCRNKGLEVYCEPIESFLCNSSNQRQGFDFVVAFHCLEHVSNPKEFVVSMLSLLNSNGKIFLSTPYSPMSFEAAWFDPLNHPPHHLTRWNVSSYNELARQLNLQCKLIMPSADRVINRTLHALTLAWNGPANLASRRRMVVAALQHPLTTFKELIRQNRREKVNDKVAANVVLVEFTRK